MTFNFNSELYADPSLAEGVDYARRHRRLLSKNLRRTLYERLAASGGIRAEQGRILGVFPARRWLAQDAGHEAEVRRLVTQALVQQRAPDTRSAALIALVHALRCEHKIVDPRRYDLSRRQLRARAKEIARGNWQLRPFARRSMRSPPRSPPALPRPCPADLPAVTRSSFWCPPAGGDGA